MSNRIVLGSGRLYVKAVTAGADGTYTIPSDATLEDDTNLLGWIQGGATLEYTPEWYTAEDDLGMVSKKFLTKQEVLLKSGIMTWNADTLKSLCATATSTTASSKTTLKIGGIEDYNNTVYCIRFRHLLEKGATAAADKYVRITIMGSNEAGFELAFQKDAETVINAEFKAVPGCGSAGTLLVYEEPSA